MFIFDPEKDCRNYHRCRCWYLSTTPLKCCECHNDECTRYKKCARNIFDQDKLNEMFKHDFKHYKCRYVIRECPFRHLPHNERPLFQYEAGEVWYCMNINARIRAFKEFADCKFLRLRIEFNDIKYRIMELMTG